MRRVPVVVTGADAVASAFRASITERAGNLAGRESFQLEQATSLGPEPSILVDTGSDSPAGGAPRDAGALVDAVRLGHAAVTADLRALTGPPEQLAIILADRRVGVGAALLPGLPLADLLTSAMDTGGTVTRVVVEGHDPARLADEILVIARLAGLELRRDQVEVSSAPPDADAEPRWSATMTRDAVPVVRPRPTPAPDESGQRRVTMTVDRRGTPSTMTLQVPAADAANPAVIAAALFADVLALARAVDEPWRAHRRQTADVR